MPRIVVIGGVAAGMSAAALAKRRSPDAKVIVFERGAHVSYSACGMPYNIEDPERSMEDLIIVPARDFREKRGIDLRTRHEVLNIDTYEKRIAVRDLETGRAYDEPYDRLVIATGASPMRPDFPGANLPGVFVLRALSDGEAIKSYIARNEPKSAAIIGGGYVGMEMAESLRMRGIKVTVLEKEEQLLPGYDAAVAEQVLDNLKKHFVKVELGARILGIEKDTCGHVLCLTTKKGDCACDMVLLGAGIRPNVDLAKEAGIQIGATGAIAVDDMMRTSAADVYAAGDCAEVYHRVSGRAEYIPLGDTANKQGKVAGANAAGGAVRFAGVVGTRGFKVFELAVGRTGLGAREISDLGLEAVASTSTQDDHAESFLGKNGALTTVLFAEKKSGRLLGAQMVGCGTVAKRIDVLATALYAKLTVDDLASLDLCYAPPFSPVYDPVLIAATVAQKDLAGK